jgi:hypothetical protein
MLSRGALIILLCLNVAAALVGAAERELVCVLEVATDR